MIESDLPMFFNVLDWNLVSHLGVQHGIQPSIDNLTQPFPIDQGLNGQVEPSRDSLMDSCFTTELGTRSQIRRLPRQNIHTETR